MKNVISFALWGKNTLYVDGAIWNAEHREEFYPGWVCRFYHDDSVPKKALKKIADTGAEMRLMGATTDVLGMYWRFQPMFDDPEITRFIVRDTDSKFSQREVNMVNQWIATGKPFHIIRDNEVHCVQILGGTWGAIAGCIPGLDKKMSLWLSGLQPNSENPRGLFHGTDQMFLTHFIWPEILDNHCAHIRANMPHLRYTRYDIEVPDPEDGHYVGMVC